MKIDAPVIANYCYSPSYISFEYVLSYHGLIPEYVKMYTSACFGKKKNKRYVLDDASFEYRSIPDEAFPFGIEFMKNENKMNYKIATKEKALCDTLYSKYPVRSIKDLKILLFDDLRIDENEFLKLDFDLIISFIEKYHSNTLNTLYKYILEVKKMASAIEMIIKEYNPQNTLETKAALREIIQSIILLGLNKSNFFKKASFYGGTALRIFYGLNRFSEDLDFTLNYIDEAFCIDEYVDKIKEVSLSYGLDIQVEHKIKRVDTSIESVFAKLNTY